MHQDKANGRDTGPGADQVRGTEDETPGTDTLKDASDEAVAEMEKRRDGGGHSGTGDIG
jgi:hypothetical protein